MSELFFVLKTLLFTAALVVLMQVKLGGSSIEQKAHYWLEKSETSIYVQSVAAGGAMMLVNLTKSIKQAVAGGVDNLKDSYEEKAAR